MAIFGLDLPLVLLLAGIGLLILEAVSPTEYFLILGAALIGAGVVGSVAGPLSGPIALGTMTLAFGLATFYAYQQIEPYGSGEGGVTTTADSLRGATGTVVERVTDAEGRVKLDDGGFNPYYGARALDEPVPEGEEVLVVDPGGGNVLTVTSQATLHEDSIDRELRREAERAEAARQEQSEDADRAGGSDAGAGTGDEADADADGSPERSDVDLETERGE